MKVRYVGVLPPLLEALQTVGWLLLVSVLLFFVVWAVWTVFGDKRRSDTGSFVAAVLSQLKRHQWVAVIVLSFSFVLVMVSHIPPIEVALVVTFFGVVATFISLMNTYYIMHGMESRIYDYNKLIDRLAEDLKRIIDSKKEPQDWAGEYLYILALTPLLGSISAEERRYDLYRDRLGTVVKNADTVFVRTSEYRRFHETYAESLGRLKPEELGGFVESRNRHLEQLLDLNRISATDGKQAFDKAEIPLGEFPPYYIYVSRNLTAICLVRHEPRVGNEVVAIVSGERFYREFARELFPWDMRDQLQRIEG